MSTNYTDDSVLPDDWVSQAEAARIRNVSRQAIAKLINRGRLRSRRIGGHILVNRHDVLNFEPLQAGRRRSNDSDAN